MQVSNIHYSEPSAPGRTRICADVAYRDRSGERETLWFEIPSVAGGLVTTSADPWLAALMPLASSLGEALHLDAPVDPVLLESSRALMEWWRYWFPSMQVVPLQAAPRAPEEPPRASRTAQFFSGGVDSFFTTLRHQDASDPLRVDDLLFGWGFDEHPLGDTALFERLSTKLSEAAERLGKRFVAVSTNIRHTRFRQLAWGPIGHGSAMAAVALLLQRVYARVLVPSSAEYRETFPWGSHAAVDHLHSSTTMRVVHDGAAYSRFQKVALVASSPVALSVLRVCWQSQSDANCGKCEKCLRTMVALELYGVLDQASTFAHVRLDLDRVANVYCPPAQIGSLRLYYDEMLQHSRQRDHHELATAIQRALGRSYRRRWLLALTQRLCRMPFVGRCANRLDTALRRSLIT